MHQRLELERRAQRHIGSGGRDLHPLGRARHGDIGLDDVAAIQALWRFRPPSLGELARMPEMERPLCEKIRVDRQDDVRIADGVLRNERVVRGRERRVEMHVRRGIGFHHPIQQFTVERRRRGFEKKEQARAVRTEP